MLDKLRPLFKRLLYKTPLFDPAKRVWDRMKQRSDAKAFLARNPGCAHVHYDKAKLAELRKQGYQSQYGQDHYLWTKVLNAPTQPGYYVDIGANDPVHNSNSNFLESEGWDGAVFDPLASVGPLWAAKRKAAFHNAAVSAQRERLPFVEFLPKVGWESQISGFEAFVRPEDIAVHEHRKYEVECGPLTDFVPADRTIDVMFVDVEGAEDLVLAGIDFDKIGPRYLMIENMREIGGSEAIRDLLRAKGYRIIARIGATDDLFERAR